MNPLRRRVLAGAKVFRHPAGDRHRNRRLANAADFHPRPRHVAERQDFRPAKIGRAPARAGAQTRHEMLGDF